MANFSKLQEKEKLSETQFYSVVKKVGNEVELKNDHNGESIIVSKAYVETFLTSSSQFSKENKVTQTEIIDLFKQGTSVALEVNFNKKVDEKDVLNEILETYKTSTPAEIEGRLKKTIKGAIQGVPRTLKGYHFGHQDAFGRYHIIDMESPKGTGAYDARNRLVDPRTINYLIIRDTKYVVK